MELDEAAAVAPLLDVDLLRLDEALNALAAMDPRQAKVVELRFFGGLTEEETAEALQVSFRHRAARLEEGKALALESDDS